MHLTNKCIYAQLRCICLFIGFTVNSFSVSHTLIAIQRNCTLSLIYISTDSIMHTLIWCMVFSRPDALYLAAGVWTSLLLLPSPNPHVISHHPPLTGSQWGRVPGWWPRMYMKSCRPSSPCVFDCRGYSVFIIFASFVYNVFLYYFELFLFFLCFKYGNCNRICSQHHSSVSEKMHW